jgi:hypothetical protein
MQKSLEMASTERWKKERSRKQEGERRDKRAETKEQRAESRESKESREQSREQKQRAESREQRVTFWRTSFSPQMSFVPLHSLHLYKHSAQLCRPPLDSP